MSAFTSSVLTCGLVGDALTGQMACLSPNGEFVANASGSKIIVRRLGNPTEVVQVYQAIDKVEKLEFSPNSLYLLVGLFTRNAIQIFSLSEPDWNCRINEGMAGVINAQWLPDSLSVMTESDFGVYLSIWSLTDNTQSVISLPKPVVKGFKCQYTSFSDNKQFLSVLHRIELQDHIGVYSLLPNVVELHKFKTRSNDVAMISWVPNDTHIVTIDTPLTCRACVYLPSGEVS